MRVEKRINEIVNRLNRTKVERKPDLKGKLHILHISFIMSSLQRLTELFAGKNNIYLILLLCMKVSIY